MREPPSSPGDGRKPGQSATPCGPRGSRRPYRHPIPGGAAGSERSQRSRGPACRYGLREQSGHGAGVAPPGAEQPRSRRRITTSPRPAFVVGRASRRRRHASRSTPLCERAHQARPIAVIVPAVGLARGEERHSGQRAGWSCFVDRAQSADRRHDPVWTALLGRTAAAARRRRVLVHQVQLERAGFRSDRAGLPSKRSAAGPSRGRSVPCGGVCSS